VKFNVQIEQVRPQTDDDPGTTALLTSPQSALMTIGHLLAEWKREEQEADRKPTKAKLAEDVIREYMADQEGDVLSSDVKDHLRDQGFGKVASEDAMRHIGQSASRKARGKWFYTLTDSLSPQTIPVSQEVREIENIGKTGSASGLISQTSQSSQSSEIHTKGRNLGSSPTRNETEAS
jgi:hypothetical protein